MAIGLKPRALNEEMMSSSRKLPEGVRPLIEDLRRLPPERIRPFVRRVLEEESSGGDLSVDHLMSLGVQAREVPADLIEAEVESWLARATRPEDEEACAWFLVGNWSSRSRIGAGLLTRVAALLRLRAGEPRVRDPLVLAASFASGTASSEAGRAGLREALVSVRARTNRAELAPYALAALERALGETE